jgi:PIN like domain
MVEAIRRPLLEIPRETESLTNFIVRLTALVTAGDTHIYVDTSLLMWLTKIGSGSRRELFDWLEKNCRGRVHVPIWAAHEYLKHHVAGTIVADLAARTNALADLVGETYSYFRPFIDEPLDDGAQDAATMRAATRSALHGLERLTKVSRRWQKSYPKHAGEVIAFINSFSLENTSIYEDLKDIGQIGANRFAGSIPPGFKDAYKKGSRGQPIEQNDQAPANSNRYGDLIFWKELIAHAKTVDAKSVVLLTNDRKNDWHLGGSSDIDPSVFAIKREMKPVPRPHPMLTMEAKLIAGVHQVELLDSAYLAVLLRACAEPEVRAFADVAIIPDDTEAESEKSRRARLTEERLAADKSKAKQAADTDGHLFLDSPEVVANRGGLGTALYFSREPITEKSMALIESWRASVEAKPPLSVALAEHKFEGFDHKELVRLAREIHDLVLSDAPGYGEALTDLVSLLDRVPPNTAASLYLGLLASMYLVRVDNTSRLPPRSPVAQLLFDQQSAQYATVAVQVIEKRLRDNDFRPLYVPNVERPVIAVVFDTEAETHTIDQLDSLRVGEVELLTIAQPDIALRLSILFDGSESVDGNAIVRKACELFGLPEKQIERLEAFGNNFVLTNTIGFKRPADISIPKEDPLEK